MRLGKLAVWAYLDPMTPAECATTAARVEELGYSALWFPDNLNYDSMTRASVMLADTSNLVVATGITSIYNRPAWSTGAAQRTLCDQSDNRFLLGLGVSHRLTVEGRRRAEYGPPFTTMSRYLADLDASTSLANDTLSGLDAGDRPSLRLDRMPRVIAALGPKMLELARDQCDGAHPYLVTPEHTRLARTILGPERWLCVEQKVLAETNPDRSRAIARRFLQVYLSLPNYLAAWRRLGFTDEDFARGGSDRLVDAMVAWGEDNTIADHIEQHLQAGATQICVQVLSSRPDEPSVGPEWSTLEMIAERFALIQ